MSFAWIARIIQLKYKYVCVKYLRLVIIMTKIIIISVIVFYDFLGTATNNIISYTQVYIITVFLRRNIKHYYGNSIFTQCAKILFPRARNKYLAHAHTNTTACRCYEHVTASADIITARIRVNVSCTLTSRR